MALLVDGWWFSGSCYCTSTYLYYVVSCCCCCCGRRCMLWRIRKGSKFANGTWGIFIDCTKDIPQRKSRRTHSHTRWWIIPIHPRLLFVLTLRYILWRSDLMGMHADDDVDEEWVEKDDAEQMEMPIYNNPNRAGAPFWPNCCVWDKIIIIISNNSSRNNKSMARGVGQSIKLNPPAR